MGVSQVDCSGDSEVRTQIAWDDVSAVFAYKRDCFAYDKIYVAMADPSGQVRVEVCEDDAGYERLTNELPKRLAGCLTPDVWFFAVAAPAFETNLTELYRRSS